MFRFLTNVRARRLPTSLFGVRPQTGGRIKPRRPHKAHLEVECLESRFVPTTSWPTAAILDFGGGDISAAQMKEGGWGSRASDLSLPSFHSLFDGSRPGLDMNGDAVVDLTDANIAINRILAKVKEDFAPYNLEISLGDHNTYRFMLTDTTVGDVIVMVTGGGDILAEEKDGHNDLGACPTDVGNSRDEIAFAFGGILAGVFPKADKFVNAVAATISHEMGHAFGLKHVLLNFGDEVTRHELMAESTVGDFRDFQHDFHFQDIAHTTEAGGTQNSHQYLTQTLGPSTKQWLAVLGPGQLTVVGTDWNDTIEVTKASYYSWVVTINGVSSSLNRISPNIESLNPFEDPLTHIEVLGKAGDDLIIIDENITVETWLLGGANNDTIHGGGGMDIICGGHGNDRLFGRRGVDYLLGEAGNDYLDGGSDGVQDFLYGGFGADVFVAERYSKWGYTYFGGQNRDTPQDFNALERDYIDWGIYYYDFYALPDYSITESQDYVYKDQIYGDYYDYTGETDLDADTFVVQKYSYYA